MPACFIHRLLHRNLWFYCELFIFLPVIYEKSIQILCTVGNTVPVTASFPPFVRKRSPHSPSSTIPYKPYAPLRLCIYALLCNCSRPFYLTIDPLLVHTPCVFILEFSFFISSALQSSFCNTR